jgi:Lon-like ATP-dependent protease
MLRISSPCLTAKTTDTSALSRPNSYPYSKDIAQLNPLFRDQITNFSINQVTANMFDEPDKLADFAAAVSTGEVQELQDVLESIVLDDHLRKALLVLKRS